MDATKSAYTVVLTRTTDDNAVLGDALHGHFALVWGVDLRCIGFATGEVEIVAHPDTAALAAELAAAGAVAITSRPGVRGALALLGRDALLQARARGVLIGCVGPGSAAELASAGVTVDVVAEPSTAAGLGACLAARLVAPSRVWHLCGDQPRVELAQALRAEGHEVSETMVYRNIDITAAPRAAVASALQLTGPALPALNPRRLANLADAAIFFSPSSATRLYAAVPAMRMVKAVAIGPTTAEALRSEHRVRPAAVAEAPTIAALNAALARALGLGDVGGA